MALLAGLRLPERPARTIPADDPLHRLAVAAFPCLYGTGSPLHQIHAVISGQGALEAGDPQAWAAWPAAMRQECVRLMRWRELTGERPPGHAARCYAAMGGAAAGGWPGAAAGRRVPEAVASPGDWPFGREVLAASVADTTAPELVLLGWSVARVAEPADTAVACMTACLRLLGHQVDAFDLQAELPIANGGVTLAQWSKLCRRVGLQATARALPELAPGDMPALCRLHDGSCLLLLASAPQGFRGYAPGVHFPFRLVERQHLRAAQAAFICTMAGEARPQRLMQRPLRRLRFDVLDPCAYLGAAAVPPAKRALQLEAREWPDLRFEPPVLTGLSLADVLAAHRTLAAPGSPLHGRFRQVNLQGSTEMLCWEQIPVAMQELLGAVAELSPRPPQDASPDASPAPAAQVARYFIDFLRIHPFLNGNRRMAMAFANGVARRLGFALDWTSLSRVELYHAVRCAAAGHLGFLVQALACRMSRAATAPVLA